MRHWYLYLAEIQTLNTEDTENRGELRRKPTNQLQIANCKLASTTKFSCSPLLFLCALCVKSLPDYPAAMSRGLGSPSRSGTRSARRARLCRLRRVRQPNCPQMRLRMSPHIGKPHRILDARNLPRIRIGPAT